MKNYIVIAIVAVMFAISVYSTVKHFKGESGCCGGGCYKPRKKKLSNVICQKTFTVGGLHCENCKSRVEEVVNDIKGVVGMVDLKKGELTVFYAEMVDDELIKARVERAGYSIDGIK